jgi:hypothetical protein
MYCLEERQTYRKTNEIQTHKLTHSPCGNQEDVRKEKKKIRYNTTTKKKT